MSALTSSCAGRLHHVRHDGRTAFLCSDTHQSVRYSFCATSLYSIEYDGATTATGKRQHGKAEHQNIYEFGGLAFFSPRLSLWHRRRGNVRCCSAQWQRQRFWAGCWAALAAWRPRLQRLQRLLRRLPRSPPRRRPQRPRWRLRRRRRRALAAPLPCLGLCRSPVLAATLTRAPRSAQAEEKRPVEASRDSSFLSRLAHTRPARSKRRPSTRASRR